jgi:hypothetical protein
MVKHFAAQRLHNVLENVGHVGMGEITQTPTMSMLWYFHLMAVWMEDSEGSTVALCIDGVASALEH